MHSLLAWLKEDMATVILLRLAITSSGLRGDIYVNKANLRDLIAATGLVMLLKIGFNSSNFLARVTLKFDGWPRKTIGQLFYTTSRFVHHFRDIGEFKLELQSGKFSIRVKIGHVFARVTSKFDGWPWKKGTSSILHQTLCIISKPSVN